MSEWLLGSVPGGGTDPEEEEEEEKMEGWGDGGRTEVSIKMEIQIKQLFGGQI